MFQLSKYLINFSKPKIVGVFYILSYNENRTQNCIFNLQQKSLQKYVESNKVAVCLHFWPLLRCFHNFFRYSLCNFGFQNSFWL